MAPESRDTQAPSTFSVYASRFLSGHTGNDGRTRGRTMEGSQIFRAPSPSSPSRDPFHPSPSASQSQPYLPGSSRSPSPTRTPPFPGCGLAGIPDIDDQASTVDASIGVGLLFDGPNDMPSSPVSDKTKQRKSSDIARPAGSSKQRIPNPYEPSSSESEDDLEADLEEVQQIRRSLRRPQQHPHRQPTTSDRSKKGWLAHQSVFPPSSSSSSSETDESDKQTEADSDAGMEERSRMMGLSRAPGTRGKNGRTSRSRRSDDASDSLHGYALSPSELHKANLGARHAQADDLEEPLLGPDEMGGDGRSTRPPVRLQVYHGRFAHWEREGLRKYKDSGFLALWLTSVLGVLIGLLFVWGSTEPPADAPSRSPPSIVPLLPLLLVLLIPALVLPPAFILLLRHSVRPILVATAVSIPFSLFVCGWWALGASFETSGLEGVDQSDQWWSSSGMRIGAVLLWLLAGLFARLVYVRRKRLERTAAVVELSTELLLSHPPLLLLSPFLLGIFAILSIPFLTLLIRLGMIGYWRHPKEGTYVFHLRPYAGWLIFLVTVAWVWTWGVIRGVGRVAVAGVIGEWYFHRDEPNHPPALEITTAALHRATGTSLGSICLGSGIVAVVRVIGRSAAELKRITSPKAKILPAPLLFLTRLAPVFGVIAGVLDQMNGYALVYVGITGEGFWISARRAVGLAGKRKGGRLLDYTLIKLLLTLSSTAMGLFTATAGYLYMTHSLSNPSYAPVAALLCGGVPFLAIRAGASVLGDAADSLFICHQIDRELGGRSCEKAKEAFEGDNTRGADNV